MTAIDPLLLDPLLQIDPEEEKRKALLELGDADKLARGETDAAYKDAEAESAAIRKAIVALYKELVARGFDPAIAIDLAKNGVNSPLLQRVIAEGKQDILAQGANQEALSLQLNRLMQSSQADSLAALGEISAAGTAGIEEAALDLQAEQQAAYMQALLESLGGGGGGGGRGGGGGYGSKPRVSDLDAIAEARGETLPDWRTPLANANFGNRNADVIAAQAIFGSKGKPFSLRTRAGERVDVNPFGHYTVGGGNANVINTRLEDIIKSLRAGEDNKLGNPKAKRGSKAWKRAQDNIAFGSSTKGIIDKLAEGAQAGNADWNKQRGVQDRARTYIDAMAEYEGQEAVHEPLKDTFGITPRAPKPPKRGVPGGRVPDVLAAKVKPKQRLGFSNLDAARRFGNGPQAVTAALSDQARARDPQFGPVSLPSHENADVTAARNRKAREDAARARFYEAVAANERARANQAIWDAGGAPDQAPVSMYNNLTQRYMEQQGLTKKQAKRKVGSLKINRSSGGAH
jgi:hypothetical protein